MAGKDQSCVALWRALFRASRMVEERVRSSTEARGLGASDFGILEVLREHGPLPVNVLGEKVSLTSGSITSAVDRLSKRALVARRSSEKDSRSKLVELLPAGRRLIDCATLDHARVVTQVLSALTPRERREALVLLTKLTKNSR
jgi:MarR family transcriptional regulator, 2-MHQ and catechol-resistance regulon repressor